MPHTRHLAYLDHAAAGAFSQPVVDALDAYTRARSGSDVACWESFVPTLERALARLGRLVGAPPERVEFAANTSEALNLLAEGLDWQPGDRIAVPACEFPANVYPFLHLRRRGVEVDFIPHDQGVVSLDALERVLTPRTRLVSVSWVQFLSGYRMDLAAAAERVHARGAWFCVDAIQGLGALPLDAPQAGVDFLACGAQKWLMGPRGLAFFYVSEGLQPHVTPRVGWLNGPVDWEHFLDYRLDFFPDARRYRAGTLNQMGIAALDAALGLYFDAGPEACAGRVLELAGGLRAGLDGLGLPLYGTADPDAASGIVTASHPDATGALAALERAGVAASVRNGLLRFSPSWYNTPDETGRALDALRAFSHGNA